MSYYEKHIFFCCNQRDNGEKCCNNANATMMANHAKEKLNQLGLSGKKKIRLSRSGCLGRCAEGPVMVIYPEQTWYTYHQEADIDAIIEQDIVGGEKVTRLLLED